MRKFNLKPLGIIISSLVMAAVSQAVLAQEAEDAAKEEPEVEEMTVTGFAKSIASAIETKRNADTVIQAISAEDIGGLPDKSIADSLSRLPGVTVTRKGGQAGTIQVRGMGEGYVFSTLNGREQVSPSGGRAMEYSQFPSELISSVEVYMSPKASLIEGGVAGTVELKTVNPLDMNEEQKVGVSVRGNYNDQASDLYDSDPKGHRISLSYQRKLLDDTLGFSLGYAQLKEPKAAITFEQFNYDIRDGDYLRTNGMKMMQESGETLRDGYMAAVQFEPNENLSVQTDAFYSKFDIDSTKRGLFFDNFGAAVNSSPEYLGQFQVGGHLGKRATDTGGFTIKVATDNSKKSYELFSTGLNVTWKNEALTVSGDISHSDASGYDINGQGIAELYTADATSPSGYKLDTNQSMNYHLNGISIPNISVSADYTNPKTLRLTSQAYYPYLNEDSVDAIRFDTKYELEDVPVISSVEAGVRYSKRNHKETRELFKYGTGDVPTDYPLKITTGTSDVVHWQGAFSGMPSFLAVDGDEILQRAIEDGVVLRDPNRDGAAAYDADGNLVPRNTEIAARWSDAWSFQQNSDIDEKVSSIYLQANISTEIADRELTGNIGVRYLKTDQSNRALVDVFGDVSKGAVTICDVTGECNSTYAYKRRGAKYDNVLPSLNLNYHLTDDDQLRGAVARVLSRAPINRLSSFDFGTVDLANAKGPTYNYGDSNSPTLTPFIADQIDISYEHYMNDTNGSFSIAAYHREIKSFIQSTSIENYDFDADPSMIKPKTAFVSVGGTLVEKEVLDGTYRYAINNSSGGYIRGLEFAYTQTFNFLPSYFSGLGFSGSLSFTDSKITVANPVSTMSNSLPFPGLVEKSSNFTIFYAYEGFETRLSTTYQAEFVGESRNIGPELVPVTYAAETVLDYQASYKFESGVDIVFSVGNLTNEPNRSFFSYEALPLRLNWFGRTYSLGANYTF